MEMRVITLHQDESGPYATWVMMAEHQHSENQPAYNMIPDIADKLGAINSLTCFRNRWKNMKV